MAPALGIRPTLALAALGAGILGALRLQPARRQAHYPLALSRGRLIVRLE
ncbi:MAG: hypothetical protein IPM84_16545 [Anaerolineae bacterium]|nr:hypothetical protein [Anaerolineae bacterium]